MKRQESENYYENASDFIDDPGGDDMDKLPEPENYYENAEDFSQDHGENEYCTLEENKGHASVESVNRGCSRKTRICAGVVAILLCLGIISVVVVVLRVDITYEEELKREQLKDNLLIPLENEGVVFMEMDSFQKGLLIIKLGGQFYTIDDSFITITNMTMPLKTLSPQDVNWKNLESFEFKQREFSKVIISKEAPDSSYPVPGIYVKSTSSGNDLVMVFYSSTNLVGMKLTGSAHVPSSKTTFTFNMETNELMVQHANKGFVSPYWSEDYKMVNITKYKFKLDNHKNSKDDSVYDHISRFVPFVIE
eukprot:GFUD01016482.1.p1 GENE.GFUD01016482.1~~GFUD01016482.1.p1  ORF type:complete len:307 (-),score=63.30 GFUD01016482.1:68-988(-)